jgi:capsular exopolysaccharide synthesis family protein
VIHTQLDRHLVSLTAPASFAAEQYQGLRLKVERLRQDRDVRVIAVTSAGPHEGKTLTAINLAGALARGSSVRVLLIDADLRRPAIAKHLHVEEHAAGVAELIADPLLRLEDIVQRIESFNMTIVPAGLAVGPVHEILRSPRFQRLLDQAREQYDYVVVDTPPLVPLFDSVLLGRLVDGLIVVVAANRTPRKLLGDVLDLLDASKVLGIVFNGDDRTSHGRYGRYYRRYFTERPQLAHNA